MPPASFPPLLALTFGNLPMLAGLAAAAIPILIHLLNRRKFRETRWAAMRFLVAAIRKNQRRIRIEQWLLLAVRTLLIVLVVTAMAKPLLEAFGNVVSGRRTHRVLVLDGSLSMGHATAGTTRFDQAKVLAAQLVKDSRPGDAISLILMGEPPRILIGDPTPNQAEVQKEIQELPITHGATNLVATFEAVDRVLEVSSIPQKELIFLTDLQATSWRPKEGSANDGLDRVVARIEARQPRSVVIDLGRAGSENRAVTGLQIERPVVTAGATVPVRGTLHNYGPSRAEGVLVRLSLDGRVGPEQSVDLPVGEDVAVLFNEQFLTAGDHVLELSMDNDALPLDDRRTMAVPVRDAVKVLLVDGQFKSEPFQAETDYLAQALAPTEGSASEAALMRADVIPESQFSRRELGNNYDVVGLCNVAQFSQPEVAALEDFLAQGGGIVVFGGDQVIADNYNRLLHADGNGLLPAAIGPTIGDAVAARKQGGIGLNPLGFRHPLIADFRGESDPVTAGLTRALTYQHHKLVLPKGSAARVAIAFDDGDPAIVEATRSRGRVYQVATSADAGWTSWPLHNSYLPVMQQLFLLAAAGKLEDRNIRVGQPYDRSYPATGAASTATVSTPRGGSLNARLKAAGGLSLLHFEQTDLAGAYQVRVGPPLNDESTFAASPDPAESDPAKLDRAALAQRIPGWNFLLLDNWRELSRSAASMNRRGELHRSLLIGALMLLLLESFLAWRFGHHEPSA
ncbi:BatA domain-containing protein [Aquisphaera insulae]|uniref:BatA domain-containing protein n=1 Tax=Aquisphaera insulae TaxID=2712864 RepID=UPI0013EB9163|nr:VWA domain-containing protein [Aquisphaera insulae]